MKKLNFAFGLDFIVAFLACCGALAVLQTFIIGRHFIIPTMILVLTVIMGNLAWYGFQQSQLAKRINFWLGVVLSSHCFFALFWAKKYRYLLGDLFLPVGITLTLFFVVTTYLYAHKNKLFKRALPVQ